MKPLLSIIVLFSLYFHRGSSFINRATETKTRLSKAWSGSNLYDSDVNLKNRIKKLRGKQIKDILVKENINVRGMIEKSEFEAELFKAEMKYLEKSSYLKSSIQLKKVAFPNMQKSYVAVEAKIQNQLCTFLIDTGATINAINSQTAKLLQLSSYPQARYSHGLGGGSKIASSYTILDRMTIGTKEFYHTKADILDYDTFLPPGTCGILGINFFREQHNNDLYLFDFHQSILEIAPYQGILSPMNKMNFKRVNGKRIANILFADASVTSLTNHHCKVLGMVDIGSSYTMINLSAVRTLGYNPDTLPLSNVYCTGIDGKPFQMKSFEIGKLQLGEEFAFNYGNKINIFATDVPGLNQIGLQHTPAIILGIDLLENHRAIYDFKNDSFLIEDS